jgi:lipoprotein NlpD
MLASVAQSVEQRTENPCVGGSIPPLGTFAMRISLIFAFFISLFYNTIADERIILHNVTKTDTLFSISRQYNISVENIKKLNNLKKDSVMLGQKLKIPDNKTIIKQNAKNNQQKNIPNKNTAPQKTEKEKNPVLQIKTINTTNQIHNTDLNNFHWPAKGEVAIKFGQQHTNYRSEGIYIRLKEKTNIKASASGHVVYVGNAIKEFGTVIIIKHPNNFITVYGNNTNAVVKSGDFIQRDQIISQINASTIKPAKFYFSIRRNGKSYNPEKIIGKLS